MTGRRSTLGVAFALIVVAIVASGCAGAGGGPVAASRYSTGRGADRPDPTGTALYKGLGVAGGAGVNPAWP